MRAPRSSRYEVVEEIGRGGMSIVYRARDRKLGRDVALKVLHGALACDVTSRRRLHREALAVARLRHPGIVEVYDSSEPEAQDAWLVTELIEGCTLRAWLERYGRPELPEVGALITLALARALRHAHGQGVLHRDLKPENVMVTPGGALKLMDFGLAQILDGNTRLTAAGTLLGSPAHMAPEIIDGQVPDHRADLFSLGTVLYWLLTGALPFEARTPSALFKRILEGSYDPPQLLAPRVGNGLASVVERALEPRVEARYQDISELEADLEAEVSLAGFADIDLSLALVDPAAFTEAQAPRLFDRLVSEGRAALQAGDLARAADRLNRAAAHRPDDPAVAALLERATRTRAPAPAAALVLAGACSFGALALAVGLADLAALNAKMAPAEERDAGLLPSAPSSASTSLAPKAALQVDSGLLAEEGLTDWGAKERRLQPVRARLPTDDVKDGGVSARSASAGPPASRARAANGPAVAGVRGDLERPPVMLPSLRPAPPPDLSGESGENRRRGEEARPDASAGAQDLAAKPAVLHIRIGQSFATVRLDGQTRLEDSFRGDLELSPGLHQVEVVKPGMGRFRARTIEVTPAGVLFEHLPNGRRRRLVGGVLDFRIPLSKEEGSRTPGWIPG